MKRKHIVSITLLLAAAVPLLTVNLSTAPVQNWDEATNTLVVHESLQRGSFFTLYYEEEPFFEKPPLWYWLTEGIVLLFGFSEVTIRMVSVFSSLGIIILIYLIGNKIGNRMTGLTAAFIFMSIPHLIQVNAFGFSTHTLRSADLDTLQLLFILSSFFSFLYAGKSSRAVIFGYFFSALAFMTKGPMGLMPIFLFFVYSLIRRPRGEWTRQIVYQLPGIGIFLLVSLPWYLYQTILYGNDFVYNHFGYHLVERSLSVLEGHDHPWTFYFEILFSRAFGFGLLLIASISFSLRKGYQQITSSFAQFGILGNILVPLLLLTLAQTKLTWYLFYIYPFAAISIGEFAFITIAQLTKNKLLLRLVQILVALSIIYFMAANLLYVLQVHPLTNYCMLDPGNRHEKRSLAFYEITRGSCYQSS